MRRRHPARPQRARGAAVGARAHAGRLRADRGRQRLDRRLRRRWPRRSAPRGRREPQPGFGAACFAGLCGGRAATSCASWTATRRSIRASCRGSPTRSPPAPRDLVLGARSAQPGAWPLHARVANRVLAVSCGGAPASRCAISGRCAPRRREALLALGIADRRFGWPLEMVLRAAAAGWRDRRGRRRATSRATGRSKVTGTVQAASLRAVRDMAAVLPVSAAAHRDRQGAGARPGRRPA